MKKVFVFLFLVININTASLSQLDEIAGIGPKYAQAIIDSRPFLSVDDLSKVKGIGEKTLQKIKEQGFACVDCESEQTPTEAVPETVKITYPAGIFINEILPSPEGSDETDEWIELYNSNNFEVDLSGWKIKDTNGTPKTFTIFDGVKILADGFLVFKRPETKIMLNNDADGLNLLFPDNKTADSVIFNSAVTGQSYSKTSSGWAWSNTLTPGAKNIITSKTLPKTKKSDKNNLNKAGLANLSQNTDINQEENIPAQAGKTTSPWFLFYTTLAITLILASIILFTKFKLQKNVRT